MLLNIYTFDLFGVATNRDVLLTEACYCSQLYRRYLNLSYLMTFDFRVKIIARNSWKIQVRPWAGIHYTLPNIFILLMRDQILPRSTRPSCKGLITLTIGWPVHIVFPGQALASPRHLAVLKYLTLPTGSLCIKLETL